MSKFLTGMVLGGLVGALVTSACGGDPWLNGMGAAAGIILCDVLFGGERR